MKIVPRIESVNLWYLCQSIGALQPSIVTKCVKILIFSQQQYSQYLFSLLSDSELTHSKLWGPHRAISSGNTDVLTHSTQVFLCLSLIRS